MNEMLEQDIEMAKDENLNIIARMFHNGEEIEGPDGLAIMVDMVLWNDACEAFENIIADDLDEQSNTEVKPTREAGSA